MRLTFYIVYSKDLDPDSYHLKVWGSAEGIAPIGDAVFNTDETLKVGIFDLVLFGLGLLGHHGNVAHDRFPFAHGWELDLPPAKWIFFTFLIIIIIVLVLFFSMTFTLTHCKQYIGS